MESSQQQDVMMDVSNTPHTKFRHMDHIRIQSHGISRLQIQKFLSQIPVQQLLLTIMSCSMFAIASGLLITPRTYYLMYDIPITFVTIIPSTLQIGFIIHFVRGWALMHSRISLLYATTTQARQHLQTRQLLLMKWTWAFTLITIFPLHIMTMILCIVLNVTSSIPSDASHRIFMLYFTACIPLASTLILSANHIYNSRLLDTLRESLLIVSDDVISPAERQQRQHLFTTLQLTSRGGRHLAIHQALTGAGVTIISSQFPIIHHFSPIFLVSVAVMFLVILRGIAHTALTQAAPSPSPSLQPQQTPIQVQARPRLSIQQPQSQQQQRFLPVTQSS